MSKDKKKLRRKVRISKRHGDAYITTWTPLLDKNPDFHSGWRMVYSDGTVEDVLDKSSIVSQDKTPTSARERILIEQLAAAQSMLADAGLNKDGTVDPVAQANQAEDGLVQIPEPPDDKDLTNIADTPGEKPPIRLLSPSKMTATSKENLIVHAHKIDPTVNLPDGAGKRVLVELITKMQDQLT